MQSPVLPGVILTLPQRLQQHPVGLQVGIDPTVLLGQEGVGPAGGGQQHYPVGAILERPGGSLSHLKTAARGRRRRIQLLLKHFRPAAHPDHVAAIAVHRHRQHRIVESLAVQVQEQQGIGKGMAQAGLFVERLVSVGHIHSLINQAAGQVPAGFLMAGNAENLVLRLAPNVGPVTDPVIGLEVNLVVGQDAEGGNNVLPEVLVLVIAPNQDKVRVKGIYFLADFAEGGEDLGPVGLVRGNSFVVAPFGLHLRRPVGRVLHVLRYSVGFEHPDQGPGLVLVGHQPRGIVSSANAQYLCHIILPFGYSFRVCHSGNAVLAREFCRWVICGDYRGRRIR